MYIPLKFTFCLPLNSNNVDLEPQTANQDDLSGGAIAGIVIAVIIVVLVLAVLVVLLVVLVWMRHKNHSGTFKPSFETEGIADGLYVGTVLTCSPTEFLYAEVKKYIASTHGSP